VETITKKQLVTAVQARVAARHSVNGQLVAEIAEQWMQEVQDVVAAGNRIEIRGFGVFVPRTRAARKARNPKTGEAVDVPATRTVVFQLGKDFKSKLNPSA